MRIIILLLFFLGSFTIQAQVVINEICAANADVKYDPAYYNFSSWVELYNPSASIQNIGGYFLSDNSADRTKWKIPVGTTIAAKSFLIIWCDETNNGMHTTFILDPDGEEVLLSTGSSVLVDKVTFPKQFTNISYGRITDGGDTWGLLSSPTPAVKNNPATATATLAPPEFSIAPGRYENAQLLQLSHPVSGVVIRYTTNGAEPTASSTTFIAPFSISKTTTVKSKAFATDRLPSATAASTFFINEHTFTIPVVSLTTSPEYLWDNTIGIYTNGTNGVDGNCTKDFMNWNQDWDRHALLEYFEPSGARKFDQHIDIRIGGACSRNFPQKSFAVKTRDKYGSKTIDQKLFETKEIESFGGFMLRNAGNDFNITQFRDAMLQSLPVGQMDVDMLAYQPAALYLNGQYWGIQNIREKIDADYIESNYGIAKNDLDLIETYGNALEGTPDAYSTYLGTLASLSPTAPETFDYIDDHIDVQEFINYLVCEIYVANTDWPGNNIKLWRQRSTNGKFRWILWDTDFGFGYGAPYDHPTLDFATTENGNLIWPNPPWSTLHIRLLMSNPEFRARFMKTMTAALNTTFMPDRVNGIIDVFQDRIRQEIPYHKARWGGNINNWNNEVENLRVFEVMRHAFMKSYVPQFFAIADTRQSLSISTSPADAGAFRLNGVASDVKLDNGFYYKGMTFDAEAVSKPGFEFKEWRIRKTLGVRTQLISTNDVWRYYDSGDMPAGWSAEVFADASWKSGAAQLGYGDGDEATVTSFGPDPSHKFITTYFRKSFNVNDLDNLGTITGSLLADDGAVVYLNGEEVFRINIPGSPTSTTLANGGPTDENGYIDFSIDKNRLHAGNNVVAVEVHQISIESSDMSFAFSLSSDKVTGEETTTSTAPVFSAVMNADYELEAIFSPVSTRTGIVINEVSASNATIEDEHGDTDDWIELYNTGTEAVDLTGLFLTDDLSKPRKHQIGSAPGSEMILAPGSFKIFWADAQVAQGPFHLNFKLSAEGESVGLYQAVESETVLLDSHTFGMQQANQSIARIPDGSGPFVITGDVTPGAANRLGLVTDISENSPSRISVYPNPGSGDFTLDVPRGVQQLRVFDSIGREVTDFTFADGRNLSLGHHPPGMYMLRFRTAGAAETLRIILK